MSYGSSYQGYQQGSSNNKNRRRDYEDVDGSGASGFSTNAYHPHLRPQQQQSSSRMQTMEVLSGREYGNEFEREGGGGVKNRFTIYAGIAVLFLMVLMAPHRDESDTTSNLKLPKNDTTSTTDGSSSAERASTLAPIPAESESAMDLPTQSPAMIDESGSFPSRPKFATICDLPPTVRRDSQNYTTLNRTNFCLSRPVSGKQCSCLNPTVPAIPSYSHDEVKEEAVGWNGTSKMNIQLINQSLAALSIEGDKDDSSEASRLDVVLLGDSITEHWNGRDMGVHRPKDYNVSLVFEQLFQKKNGSSVEGLALGIAGDRCQNVLWRLQHGEMPTALNPKVWWLLIGTNDLGVDGCGADAITIGNIRIVEEIRRQHPEARIVINSLLPRSREELLHKNEMWKILTIVNDRLACYAKTQPDVFFFNATSIFIYEDLKTEDEYGVEMYINNTLMLDYLHPSGEGALLWGKEIVKEVLNITER